MRKFDLQNSVSGERTFVSVLNCLPRGEFCHYTTSLHKHTIFNYGLKG